ncbi:nuclear transport factor 2 family protein [Paeniglutamicibacter sp. NPDC091659]|uniref:nuclear transport factor 2 family protein n=1 Tax=Paeniglutamicibacter sp. NPDC091659 TaxID=3364389 RepID=UPI0037F3077E
MIQVREAEALRCAALVNGDVDTVAKLLDPALRYVHSTGRQDTAASLLALLRTGATQYLALEHRIDRVRELWEITVVHGTMEMGIRTGARERTLNTLTTSMWRRCGNDWLLLDFQATAVPPLQ